MPAATDPIFAATPKVLIGQCATADSSRTAPSNVGTVYTAGSFGSKIEEIRIKAAGTTTAGMVRIWVYDGSNYRLLAEVLVTAITPSGTVISWESGPIYFENLVLQSGYSLRVTTANTETFNVHAFGGDF